MQTDCFPDATPAWSKLPIRAIADINPRYPIKKDREYPFIEMASVAENFGGIKYIDRRKLEGSGLSRFKVGDTLFAKITPCPENGKVALVKSLPDDVGIGSTEFIVLSPKNGCDPSFLYHLLCAHEIRGRAAARMEGSTGRQRVPDDVFEKRLLVPIPSTKEQAAIGRVLSAVDAAIERTHKVLSEITVLRRALMQELLPSWIGFRHLAISEAPTNVESIELAKDVADVCNGSTPSRTEGRYWRDGTVPWLATGKVHDRVIVEADEYVTKAALKECSISLLPRGTVLVGMIGQGRTRGMAAYLDIEACINQNFGAFVPRERLFGKWLFYYFDYHYSRLREIGGGTNQGALNCYLLKRIRLPLPSIERQKEVAGVLDGVEESYTARKLALERQMELKKSLMHDLLTGRVRVKNVDLEKVMV
jgi:type I restriction enzyme, S subunit